MTQQDKEVVNTPDFIARMMAVQAFYQISQNDEESLRMVIHEYIDHRRVVRSVDGEDLGKPNQALFKKILIGLEERALEVDEILKGHLKPEVGKNIEPLLKAVLHCGIYEILCHLDIDKALIINDYLNVSHSFYDKGQVSLVNGILDSVAKLLRN